VDVAIGKLLAPTLEAFGGLAVDHFDQLLQGKICSCQ
jgi:hypothetical protein